MSEVTREHLAGLKLARDNLNQVNAEVIDPLIAQASAAPEQETVAPIKIEVRDGCVYLRSGPLDPGEYKLYPHADPSEVERLLIAECWLACGGNGPATREELLSALRLMNEVEDEQDAAIKAATQRADAAERKLGEVANVLQAVQEQFNRYGDRLPDGFDTRVFRWVDDAVAAQYASAEPAECQHRYMHFGTQPARRCADCNKVEPAKGGNGEVV